jgi:hypothetical protein
MNMKQLVAIALGMCALGLTMPANANGSKGCILQGSFMGVNLAGTPVFTGVYVPLTAGTGIIDVSFVGFDLTLGGWFPDAVRDTGIRGTWVRTGGHTFAATGISIVADAAGATQYSVKLTVEYTMSDDCNQLQPSGTAGIYTADMNPLTDAPLLEISPPPEVAYRITPPPRH